MSKIHYIDIHGHVNFAAYDADREEVITRAQDSNVAMITVGTQFDTSKEAVELAEKHEGMFAVVGLHPIHTQASHHDEAELGPGGNEFTSRGEVPDIEEYRKLAKHPKVVAIGECGLDYYRLDGDSEAKQRIVFEQMIELAQSVGKPLMLHLRNGSSKSAYNDAYDILKSHKNVKGNLHFFAGSIEEAKPFLDLGYTFSFTGVITFARNYDEAIRYLPHDRIMTETDCPFVSPTPFRGKRNEPAHVREVVKALAKIRKEDEDKVRAQVLQNTMERFRLDV